MHTQRLIWAILGLTLFPVVVQADALSALGEAQFLVASLPFIVLGLILLLSGFIFSIKDFLAQKTRLGTLILLGVNLLVGICISIVNSQISSSSDLFPNVWTKIYLPFGALLLAINKTRQTTTLDAKIKKVALVAACALALAGGIFSLYFPQLLEYGARRNSGMVVAMIVIPGVWLTVLRKFKADIKLISESPKTAPIWWLLAGSPALAASYLLLLQFSVANLAAWNNPTNNSLLPVTGADALFTYLLYAFWAPMFYLMFWGIDSRR